MKFPFLANCTHRDLSFQLPLRVVGQHDSRRPSREVWRNGCAKLEARRSVGSLPILADLDPASPLVYCPCLALPRLGWPATATRPGGEGGSPPGPRAKRHPRARRPSSPPPSPVTTALFCCGFCLSLCCKPTPFSSSPFFLSCFRVLFVLRSTSIPSFQVQISPFVSSSLHIYFSS